jgi:hypothetical protein
MMDTYQRLHKDEGQFFIPNDLEISVRTLRYILARSRKFKGLHGTRRKVLLTAYRVDDHLDYYDLDGDKRKRWRREIREIEEEIERLAGIQKRKDERLSKDDENSDSEEEDKSSSFGLGSLFGSRKSRPHISSLSALNNTKKLTNTTLHLSIYNVTPRLGKKPEQRDIYRHFLRTPDGALIEAFENVESLGAEGYLKVEDRWLHQEASTREQEEEEKETLKAKDSERQKEIDNLVLASKRTKQARSSIISPMTNKGSSSSSSVSSPLVKHHPSPPKKSLESDINSTSNLGMSVVRENSFERSVLDDDKEGKDSYSQKRKKIRAPILEDEDDDGEEDEEDEDDVDHIGE